MGDTSWTREQSEAISQRDCNLLVAAAAGAGKTAVLVERIIRKITDNERPVDIDKLLVVTFTNAAATEMRERIGRSLEEALEKEPASALLQKQMSLLDNASIMTIHSFCLEVVRNNFHAIDIDPAFRIADETETVLMKLDVIEELFEEMYENGDEDFFKLVDSYGGGRDDVELKELVLKLYSFIQSHPWPEEWLEEHTEEFNLAPDTELGSTKWGKILIESISIELEGLAKLLERARTIAAKAIGLEPYLACLDDDLRQTGALLNTVKQWDDLHEAFGGYQPTRLPRCGKDADAGAQEMVKQIRKEVKDRLNEFSQGIFNSSSSDIKDDLHRLYPLFKCLSHLASELRSKYAAKKKDKALLDFNDLEHFCLQVLIENGVPTAAARGLRERFEEILIDEYQDSNLIQEYILSTISGNADGRHNVFMVGDVKQSIYRFRQARPELFLSKYNSYPADAGSDNRKILLSKNFRSRCEVVNAVNFIFKQIMSVTVGELDYTAEEALYPGAVYEPCDDETVKIEKSVEVNIIDMSDGMLRNDDDSLQEDGEEQLDAIQAEARIVAARIRQLVEGEEGQPPFKVYDGRKKTYRKAEYKDIVILLRTTRNWAGVFSEELGLQGVPAYADTGSGYFKTIEIQTVLSLLQIIDNPLQDIPLLAVLRSPISMFTTDELVDIRLVDRKLPFFEALSKFAQENTGETAERASKFLQALSKWRDKALYLSTDELIWYLYTETSYYSYVGILPGGVQRRANLRMLFERARQYEQTSYKGLFNFINFINRLKSGGGDMGSAKVLGENENVVRIMSIHKSKGLEFPVVILSGCGKRFNMQDMIGRVLLHQDLGFGPDLVDTERRLIYPTISKHAVKYRLKLETLSEEMRILYVALTRAREKLVISGSARDYSKSAAKWCESAESSAIMLPTFQTQKALCLFDWIMPALARHRDGEALRNFWNGDVSLLEDASAWNISVWNLSDAKKVNQCFGVVREEVREYFTTAEDNLKGDSSAEKIEQIRSEVRRRLEWAYPYKKLSEIPAKISVTELKRRFNEATDEEGNSTEHYNPPLVKRPSFMETDRGFSAAEAGTIMHFIMQHLELCAISKVMNVGDELRAQIESFVKNELLTRQEADVARVDKIKAFFDSPIGARMLKSHAVYREIPFNMELRVNEVYEMPDGCDDETMLLQGVIDCFFETEEGIVLLDYKTDYVPENGMDEIQARYRTQIDYYVRALENMTGKKISEKYIYMFYNGEIIKY